MRNILIESGSTDIKKVLIIPKDDSTSCTDAIKISIDLELKEFVATQVKYEEFIDKPGWNLYNDQTFPTSLFREFMFAINS